MTDPQRLSETRVHALADQLFAAHQKRPSAQAIVTANGNYGSAVSAHKYLKTWHVPAAEGSALSSPLQTAITGIQAQLAAESQAKIEAVEAKAQRDLEAAQAATQQVQEQLDAQLQETASLHEQLASLQQQLSEERLARREAEDNLRERRERVAHLQGITEQQREDISRQTRSNERLQTALQEEQYKRQQTLIDQTEKATEAQAAIATLAANLDNADSENQRLHGERTENRAEVTALLRQLDTRRQLELASLSLEAVQQESHSLAADCARHKGRGQALAQHNQALKERCRQLERIDMDDAAQTLSAVTDLSQAVATLGAKVDTLPSLWEAQKTPDDESPENNK